MKPITTIGIDPSLTNIGLSIRTVSNNKETYQDHVILPKKLRGPERLHCIYYELSQVILDIKSDLIVIEGYSYKGHNLAELGEASGVIKLLCFQSKTQLVVAAPAAVKKFATGDPQASKSKMMRRYASDNEHIADARAMACLAYVYLTKISTIRHELEVVRDLQKPKGPKKRKPAFKQIESLV